MKTQHIPLFLSTFAAVWLFSGIVLADEHTERALQHAKEAVESAGDSKAVAQHASEALKHIQEAKAANAGNPAALKRLEKSEAELKAAIEKANRYHSATAVQGAKDAKAHLETVHK